MKNAALILEELVLKCIEDATPFPWPIKSLRFKGETIPQTTITVS